jgi:hypothetical protein
MYFVADDSTFMETVNESAQCQEQKYIYARIFLTKSDQSWRKNVQYNKDFLQSPKLL